MDVRERAARFEGRMVYGTRMGSNGGPKSAIFLV